MRHRSRAYARLLVLLAFSVSAISQSVTTNPTASVASDPAAVTLVQQANLALTGGIAIADSSLTGTGTWIAGSTNETGTATLKLKGTAQAFFQISAGSFAQSDTRNEASEPAGQSVDSDGVLHRTALHNCFVPAAWFSPAAVVSLAQQPSVVLRYIGQEQRDGATVNHVQFFGSFSTQKLGIQARLRKLSTVDLFLDAGTNLPLAISFNVHPETNAGIDILSEVVFNDYRSVGGTKIPFRIQRFLQGTLAVDITLNSAAVNVGLADSEFAVQ